MKLGPALKPYRKKVFLACKSRRRDGKGMQEELERSLKRLKTDYFDLYQLHAISDVEKDVGAALAPGGAVEAMVEAQKKGLVRFLGFSAHSVEAALKAMEEFTFDTILYPINYVCHFSDEFDQRVVKEARKKGMGILALKALAQTVGADSKYEYPSWYKPIEDEAEADLALRWTMSQGVTAAIPPGEESLFWLAVRCALRLSLKAVTEAETAELKKRAAGLEPISRRF